MNTKAYPPPLLSSSSSSSSSIALSLSLSLLFLAHLTLSSSSSSSPISQNDSHALTRFRLQTDSHGNLLSNWTGADARSAAWLGVRCSPTTGHVISLRLPSLKLRGPLDSLSTLDQLRVLDLRDNRLNGTVSSLLNCTNLKLLYLSRNDISGGIPQSFPSSLRRLLRLDLSDNNIRGGIPPEFSNLTRLLTLRLQNNAISGKVPDFSKSLSSLKELNLTNNELYGRLPDGMLKRFGEGSFYGNEGLCGSSPLPTCSFTSNPSSGDPADQTTTTVPSNPRSLPQAPEAGDPGKRELSGGHREGLSPGAIVAIVVANCVLVLVVVSFVVAHFCAGKQRSSSSMSGSENGKRRSSYGSEKKVYAANNGGGADDSDGTNATDRSRLVFFDKRKPFELEDLLRASAEMLGKGSLGTVYRAVLDDGSTVAVKRLKDANPCARKEFEQYMDLIGKIKHPNIVRLKAYYYAKEEKLLVYDYLPNGSLHSLLHGWY